MANSESKPSLIHIYGKWYKYRPDTSLLYDEKSDTPVARIFHQPHSQEQFAYSQISWLPKSQIQSESSPVQSDHLKPCVSDEPKPIKQTVSDEPKRVFKQPVPIKQSISDEPKKVFKKPILKAPTVAAQIFPESTISENDDESISDDELIPAVQVQPKLLMAPKFKLRSRS